MFEGTIFIINSVLLPSKRLTAEQEFDEIIVTPDTKQKNNKYYNQLT